MSQNHNAEYQIPAIDYNESTLHEEINDIYSKIGNFATNYQFQAEKPKNPVIIRLCEIGTDIEKARGDKLEDRLYA